MKESRTVIGIDPGTNLLGFGVIEIEKKGLSFVDMGVIDLRKEKDPYVKLRRIYDEVSQLCSFYNPDDMAVESPFLGKNAQVIFKLGRAQGAAIIAAAEKGASVFEYSPRKAKMSITGNGAASKEQVAVMIKKTLGIDIEEKYLDATDALAIAVCHYYQLTNPLSSTAASTSWARFVADNPDRVRSSVSRKNQTSDSKKTGKI